MSAGEKLAGLRLGVFGKGGAGKSTLTAMLAQALHDRGCKVCVIDGDSTNFGLPEALGLAPPKRSLLDYFGGTVFSGGDVTCPVDDPRPLPEAALTLSDLPPDCYSMLDERMVLLAAGKIGGLGPGAGCDGPVAKIVRDFVLVNGNGKYLTLIDFKAGFEDSARGGLTRLDYVIVVIDPTSASIQIAGDMLQMVARIQEGAMPATAHLEAPELIEAANAYYRQAAIRGLFFVLNQIPDRETQVLVEEKLSQKNIRPLAVLGLDPAVREAWLKGVQIKLGQAENELLKIVLALEE